MLTQNKNAVLLLYATTITLLSERCQDDLRLFWRERRQRTPLLYFYCLP